MSESRVPKLIFAGLDKAGKTTIYNKVMAELDVSKLQDLRPTRGIERHAHDFLDQDFAVWDLGGQLSYRQTYLSKPEVFNQTAALIYVVDIQDMPRIEESYQYYEDILNILVNVENKPKLYVLFHKFDPELRGKLRNHFYKATRIFRKADKILNIKFKGIATSIYSNGVDLAVKRILFENFEDYSEEPKGTVKASQTIETEETQSSAPTPVAEAAPSAPTASISGTPSPSAPAPIAEPTTSAPKVAPSAPTASISGTPSPSAPAPVAEPTTSAPKVAPSAPTVELSTPAPLVEEKVEIPTKELEKEPTTVSEIEEATDKALEDAEPATFDDVSKEVVDRLTKVIDKRLKDTPEIVGLSILSSDGKQVLGIGKTDVDYERLEKLREVVGSLNPERFFKDLTDIEYRGLGHFPMEDFDIYFAAATDDYAIAVLATDVSTLMLQNAQRIVKSIRQGLSLHGDDNIEDEDQPKTKKKDLVGDLRGRLRNLSGLSDLK